MSRDVAIVIGTAVGAYFGDASMGYAIGSLVGNAYDPVQIARQGPRLNDLKVQVSDYGKMIPKLHGVSRFAGNVIWETDIAETPHTTTSGGKGGGPTVTTTAYTYSQSVAIGLCEGPVSHIGKIWANGKLIYNVSSDSTASDAIASQSVAASMRFYTGSETQTADSLIEAHVGTGNTPAYRGISYVVFEDMQLSAFGNRLPNMEFEIIETSSTLHPAGETVNYSCATASYPIDAVFDHLTNSIWVANVINPLFYTHSISKFDAVTGARTDYALGAGASGIAFDPVTESVWVTHFATNMVSRVSIWTGGYVQFFSGGLSPLGITFDPVTESVWIALSGSNSVSQMHIRLGTCMVHPVGSSPYDVTFDWVTNSVWVTNSSTSSNTVSKVYIYTGTRIDYPTGGAQPTGIAFDPVTESVWVANNLGTTVSKIDVHSGSAIVYATNSSPEGIAFDPVTKSVWVTTYGPAVVAKISVITGVGTNYPISGNSYGVAFADSTGTVWVLNSSTNNINTINVQDRGFASIPTSLSSVVSNICSRAGLTAGQIDVTQLTDTVTGYVTQRSTARAQIEPLMQTFFFDVVESSGKVKFVKRGGAAALTILEDDVAAHSYGGPVPENYATERKQEMELPVEVNIQYMDTATAYQVSSQRAQRLITNSVNKLALNFAISMTATKAKQVADVLMYDAWTSRTAMSFSNAWKYSYLEPTDVINVVKGARTYTVRLVDEDSSSGVYRRGAVLDDAQIYTQIAIAAPPLSPRTSVSTIPLIDLLLLDIPLMRDQDDGIGFYAAACRYSGTWPGAQTYKSNDGGGSYNSFGRAILNEATIGSALTALGNFYGGNIFDELNTVTVALINGTLSSSTELGVLNGSNVLLLGSEVIQFKIATLVSTGVYTLSGLLRGRQGTDWAMSTHRVGDRAVLLSSTATYLFDSNSSEYNLARKYKAVGFGGFLADATAINFTNTGVAQECYSPVQLGGGRNTATNDVTLNWIRRTRIGGAWNNYSDVPLGEASEAYVVEIYSSSTYATLKRTISGLTSPTTTYTAAQQTADGLTPGNTVYFIVYQVSATVGNGYGARGAV